MRLTTRLYSSTMLQPLDNKVFTFDKAVSNQSASSFALPLECSNLIAARILECNGTNTGILVIPNYL